MKTSILTLAALCALVAAAAIYLNHRNASSIAVPITHEEPEPVRTENTFETPTDDLAASKVVIAFPKTISATQNLIRTENVSTEKSAGPNQTLEDLISPLTGFERRQALLKKLRKSGDLDQIIAALKQRALENPESAGVPVALGEALIAKLNVLQDSGGDYSEIGILAMQADQNFTSALKLDPSDWEAQFFKAVLMSHLPAEMNKSDEVVQRLSTLIDQQEKMIPQPQFGRTYVLLGEQYEKAGKPDYAVATWRLGAEKFPADPTLQRKLANSGATK